MPQPSRHVITRDLYDAVLLDLDGVITDTANLHAACWKQMFDEYLQKRAAQRDETFRPFDLTTDYLLYVDGKPRFDGVRAFLASRAIQLPDVAWTIPRKSKQSAGLGTARTSWSTRSSKTLGWSLMREASDSSVSCVIAGSKLPSSPRVRTARPS
jgi:beta-phosphoglucomutase-like phosphatase (HAD superfamily)